MFNVYKNRYLWINDIFFLHAALLLYCSYSLFVKRVVNVIKALKQTKLHPGDSSRSGLLPQGDTKVAPSMRDVIRKKTVGQVSTEAAT